MNTEAKVFLKMYKSIVLMQVVKKRMNIRKEEEKEERRGDDGGVASRGMDRIKGVKVF